MSNHWKSLFLLDPDIHFLNHGSFGACPQPVFEAYQAWQRRLERQPVAFLGRDLIELDLHARQALADYLHTSPSNLVYITNATHGVNIIAHSLKLSAGDEILTTDHEYGACNYTWEFICQKTGAIYVRQALPLSASSPEELTELIWQAVSPRTRLIYLSHITSPTALRLPVEEVCRRARQAGILTLVDGAHAPGQLALDLDAAGADWYTGNCHKWMLAPKGAGFLYARPEVQHLVEPLVVSWGYHASDQITSGTQFIDYLAWSGTDDPAAYLSVPAAIEFMRVNEWELVSQACRDRLRQALHVASEITGMPPAYLLDSRMLCQMGIVPLPERTDLAQLKKRLYDEYRVEIPVIDWNSQKFVRLSVQAYNTQDDLDALFHGLESLLPQIQEGA